MNHTEHMQDIAAMRAMSGDDTQWASWSSPVGLVIFFNGIALCFLIVRYAFLLK
jgi:hypothetical protein